MEIPLAKLIQGKDYGCDGCSLVCEVIPLLKDYYTEPADAEKLFVSAEGWSGTISPLVGNEPWRLRVLDDNHRCIGEFELFKADDSPAPWPCIQRKPAERAHPSVEPGSDEAYDLIAEWYLKCRSEHHSCNQRSQNEGPRRILSILESEDEICLVDCDVFHPPKYVCLSHCWGQTDFLRTIATNIEQHKAGIAIASLPKTFRDAIEMCRKLGERYLWIDSLCIIQDCEEDWTTEVPRMQAVYEGAILTISAMSARDGRGGCWAPRRRCFNLTVEDGISIELTFVRRLRKANSMGSFLDHEWRPDDENNPLARRKWSLQERLLSRRTVHPTVIGIIWQCRTAIFYEGERPGFHGYLPDNLTREVFEALNASPPVRAILITEWMKVVQSYSHALLTHETDILPALAGLARGFSNKGLGSYCAGLWEDSLRLTLCWKSQQSFHGYLRPSKYLAPSWSWASAKCAIEFVALSHARSDVRCVAQILAVECQTEDKNEFGRVQSGVLKLRTMCCVMDPGTFTRHTSVIWNIDAYDDIPHDRVCVAALILSHSNKESGIGDIERALVLTETENGQYRRCGMVDTQWNVNKAIQFTEEMVLEVV